MCFRSSSGQGSLGTAGDEGAGMMRRCGVRTPIGTPPQGSVWTPNAERQTREFQTIPPHEPAAIVLLLSLAPKRTTFFFLGAPGSKTRNRNKIKTRKNESSPQEIRVSFWWQQKDEVMKDEKGEGGGE